MHRIVAYVKLCGVLSHWRLTLVDEGLLVEHGRVVNVPEYGTLFIPDPESAEWIDTTQNPEVRAVMSEQEWDWHEIGALLFPAEDVLAEAAWSGIA